MKPHRALLHFGLRRCILLTLLFSVTAINYLDRQTLSVAAPLLENKFSLSSSAYSRIVFLFLLGYAIGQTLDGKLIDRVGTRFGMLICVALWSTVSMFHSLAMGAASLGILRFLLGLVEAANWPGGVKAVAESFPPAQRAFAIGVFNSGSTAGAIIAPPLVATIAVAWGWRPMFAVIGIIGLVWAMFWIRLYRKQPNQAETPSPLRASRSIRACLKDRTVRKLMISRFFSDPMWWFYAFWLPEYLVQCRNFNLTQIGRTAWIPFAFGGLGGWLGGFVSDTWVRRGLAPVVARKRVMAVCAFLMLCGIPAFRVESGAMALALISVVLMAYAGWASNILSLVADLFQSSDAAQITGLGGTTASIGGMLFTLATGWLIEHYSYGSVFIASSVMILCAVAVVVWAIPNGPLIPSPE